MAMFNALDAIAKRESSFKNVKTSAWDPSTGFNMSTGGVTGPSTASGYWQITNSTWKAYAPSAGVDVSQYPTAMSAPYDVQRSVAGAIYEKRGFADWAPYNAALRQDIANAGGPSAFGSDSQVAPNSSAYGQNGYTPPYDNFSPSGLDTSSLSAPGSFSTEGEPWQGSTFPQDGSLHVTVRPEGNVNYNGVSQEDADLTGNTVTAPTAGSQGIPKDVPTAIVTAANQEAKTTASAAKTTAEATLNATKQQTASDAKLQGEQQGFVANWAVRIFLFVVGAIFLAGGLFLFGGQTIFQGKSA